MSITKSEARTKAVDIIIAGLQSSSIKLLGPAGEYGHLSAAKNDLEYLTNLIDGLTEAMLKEEDQ